MGWGRDKKETLKENTGVKKIRKYGTAGENGSGRTKAAGCDKKLKDRKEQNG